MEDLLRVDPAFSSLAVGVRVMSRMEVLRLSRDCLLFPLLADIEGLPPLASPLGEIGVLLLLSLVEGPAYLEGLCSLTVDSGDLCLLSWPPGGVDDRRVGLPVSLVDTLEGVDNLRGTLSAGGFTGDLRLHGWLGSGVLGPFDSFLGLSVF